VGEIGEDGVVVAILYIEKGSMGYILKGLDTLGEFSLSELPASSSLLMEALLEFSPSELTGGLQPLVSCPNTLFFIELSLSFPSEWTEEAGEFLPDPPELECAEALLMNLEVRSRSTPGFEDKSKAVSAISAMFCKNKHQNEKEITSP
jgi:hypothetical protein